MNPARPWFRTAFGRDYLTVYRRRDASAAVAEAAAARRLLELGPGERLLDLACGAGRHCHLLAGAGLRVVGLDLSPQLLEVAARGPGAYVRGDMRRLPFPATFDAVTLFFTSFGYFGSDAENGRVLLEVARVLRPGGRFLLDLANPDHVRATLVPRSVEEVDGVRISSRRSLTADGRRVEKEVRIRRPDGSELTYTESVRLYGVREIERLLQEAGLVARDFRGGFDDVPYGPGTERLIVLGRRPC